MNLSERSHNIDAAEWAGRLLVVLQFGLLALLGWRAWVSPADIAVQVVSLLAASGLLAHWALAANRPGNFNIRPDPKAGGRLVTGGPYRHVRHPMYVAVLVFGAGMATAYAEPWRWIAFALLALVLDRKAAREERALRSQFPAYSDYAARTGRFLPRWR